MAFLQMIIAQIDPDKYWHVETTSKERGGRGGKTLLKQKLFSLRGIVGFDRIQNVVILVDNDHSQADTFSEVCKCIEAAGFGPAPAAPLVPSGGNPAVTVMLLPLCGTPGALEDELVPSARRGDWRAVRAADEAMNALSSAEWPATRRSKAWLRIFLAGASARNPFVTLSTALRDPENERLIPLDDPCFAPIRDELSKIP